MKSKTTWFLIAAGALALLALYLYMKQKNPAGSGSGPLGSNLNSVAPELVGATATGPSLGPAVSLPINITLTESSSSTDNDLPTGLYRPPVQTVDSPLLQGMNTNDGSPSPGIITGMPMRSGNSAVKPSITAQRRAAAYNPRTKVE